MIIFKVYAVHFMLCHTIMHLIKKIEEFFAVFVCGIFFFPVFITHDRIWAEEHRETKQKKIVNKQITLLVQVYHSHSWLSLTLIHMIYVNIRNSTAFVNDPIIKTKEITPLFDSFTWFLLLFSFVFWHNFFIFFFFRFQEIISRRKCQCWNIVFWYLLDRFDA